MPNYAPRKLMKKIIFIIAIFSLFSCKKIKEIKVEKIQSVQATSITLQSITLKVGAIVNNPNNFKFTLKDMDVNIFVNGNDFGKASIDERDEVAANSNDVHYFKVETNMATFLFQAIPLFNAFNNHEEIKVKLLGKVRVNALGITKNFPVDVEEKVTVK